MNKVKDLVRNIIWLFIIGCLIGYLMEFFWYYIRHDKFINVQGLLYGPFKPIYGLGILIISGTLYKFKNRNSFLIILIGILFGTIFEYSLSLFQEFVLHTKTWDYSKFSMNLNGRVYLPYCIAWGIICLLWIKYLLPKCEKLIKKIPYSLSYVATVLMIINLLLSAIAVYEFSNRQNNIKPTNKILKIMDRVYPDDVMNKKYGKLKAIKK